MRLYFAALLNRQEELLGYAESARAAGHEITSSWLSFDFSGGFGKTTDETRRDVAIQQIGEIRGSDAVILFAENRGSPQIGGGRHFEAGYALGLGKRVVVVGPAEHVFCCLPDVERVARFNGLLSAIDAGIPAEDSP